MYVPQVARVATVAATLTPTPTELPTPTPTPTESPTPSETPLETATPTPTATATQMPTFTPTATPSPSVTPTATTTPPFVTPIIVPGLDSPNGLTVNPLTNRVYITSHNNDRLVVLDGASQMTVAEIPVRDQPFGVAANAMTNRVYVANFGDGWLSVVDGGNNQVVDAVYLGAELTYVGVNSSTNRVFAVSHGLNALFVLDGTNNSVLRETNTGSTSAGAFGLAVNETLDRVYVSNRNSQTIVTFDGDGNRLDDQTVHTQPPGAVPYALGFNPNTGKLYVMLAVPQSVDRVQIYQASASGLVLLGTVAVDAGGANGGGGVAVNPHTNHVFVTNSSSNTVSILDGLADRRINRVPVGSNPFGLAVNYATDRVYVGNRADDTLSMFLDGPSARRSEKAFVSPPQTVRERLGLLSGDAERHGGSHEDSR